MKEEKIFLYKLTELRTKISTPSEPNLIGASAILRQLLLDGRPLLEILRKRYRITIRFHSGSFGESVLRSGAYFSSLADGVDADSVPPFVKTEHLTLDQFRAHKVLVIKGQPYSVRDIISFAANSYGGVHHQTKKEHEELESTNEEILITQLPCVLQLLAGIGRVVIKSSEPLEKIIKEKFLLPIQG